MGKKTTAESGRSGHGVRSEYTIKRVRRFPRKGDGVFRLTLCRNNTPVAYVTGFGRGVFHAYPLILPCLSVPVHPVHTVHLQSGRATPSRLAVHSLQSLCVLGVLCGKNPTLVAAKSNPSCSSVVPQFHEVFMFFMVKTPCQVHPHTRFLGL